MTGRANGPSSPSGYENRGSGVGALPCKPIKVPTCPPTERNRAKNMCPDGLALVFLLSNKNL